jgi:flavin-binding protein dodecin
MNETLAHPPLYTGKIRTKYADAAAEVSPSVVEFVGASDATIAEAVREALARASRSLRTLDGAGVLVIPQIILQGPAPRYRVTLQVTAAPADPAPVSAPPPSS